MVSNQISFPRLVVRSDCICVYIQVGGFRIIKYVTLLLSIPHKLSDKDVFYLDCE